MTIAACWDEQPSHPSDDSAPPEQQIMPHDHHHHHDHPDQDGLLLSQLLQYTKATTTSPQDHWPPHTPASSHSATNTPNLLHWVDMVPKSLVGACSGQADVVDVDHVLAVCRAEDSTAFEFAWAGDDGAEYLITPDRQQQQLGRQPTQAVRSVHPGGSSSSSATTTNANTTNNKCTNDKQQQQQSSTTTTTTPTVSRRRKSTHDDNKDENSARRKRNRRTSPTSSPDTPSGITTHITTTTAPPPPTPIDEHHRPRFACPYQAFDKSLDCFHPGRRNARGGCDGIYRLKQHFKRRHKTSFRCRRCWRHFENRETADKHPEAAGCAAVPMGENERFMDARCEVEVDRPAGQRTEEECWWDMFRLLIPGMEGVGREELEGRYSPYFTTNQALPTIDTRVSPSQTRSPTSPYILSAVSNTTPLLPIGGMIPGSFFPHMTVAPSWTTTHITSPSSVVTFAPLDGSGYVSAWPAGEGEAERSRRAMYDRMSEILTEVLREGGLSDRVFEGLTEVVRIVAVLRGDYDG